MIKQVKIEKISKIKLINLNSLMMKQISILFRISLDVIKKYDKFINICSLIITKFKCL